MEINGNYNGFMDVNANEHAFLSGVWGPLLVVHSFSCLEMKDTHSWRARIFHMPKIPLTYQ